MKVLSFAIAHYGVEYFDAALQSVLPVSDKVIIFYSPKPSQGFFTDAVCPDSREELKAIADKYPKVEWKDITAFSEGEHTSMIFQYSEGYDILLRFDLDEVFDPIDLPVALDKVYKSNSRWYNVNGFKHFWKSFDKVLLDWFQPARFCKPSANEGTEVIDCKIYHFGYCQRLDIIEYKIKISGHHSEWRPEWLDLYKNWTPYKEWLHPTSKTIWQHPEPFDKNTLPDILKQHPNFNKESV